MEEDTDIWLPRTPFKKATVEKAFKAVKKHVVPGGKEFTWPVEGYTPATDTMDVTAIELLKDATTKHT